MPRNERLFDPDVAGNATRVRRVRRGYDATVRALRELGRLEDVDAALVALGRTLADALDDERADPDGSAYTVGALAGRLHPIVADLRGSTADDADALAGFLAALGADVGDTPNT